MFSLQFEFYAPNWNTLSGKKQLKNLHAFVSRFVQCKPACVQYVIITSKQVEYYKIFWNDKSLKP